MLKVSQVASRLSCSATTVRALIASGALEHHRCPGIRVSEEQLVAYLEETKRERREPEPRKSQPRRPQLHRVRL